MATLDEILADTMLFTAAAGHRITPEADRDGFRANRVINRPAEAPEPGVEDEDARIWSWRLGETPGQIRGVDCLVSSMHNMQMRVCDRIDFGQVRLKTENGREISLDLTPNFLVRQYYLYNGEISAGAHPLYPLASKVDVSMMHVFAYEVLNGESAPDPENAANGFRKPDEATLARPTFMPARQPGDDANPGPIGPDEHRRLVVAPTRVVVVVSLVCGKGRADFEPGEILFAGRLNPHLMIMANKPMQEVGGAVTIARPSTSSMQNMGGMNAEIESGLYRDNNDPLGGWVGYPLPLWNNLFDDFHPSWTSPAYTMVRPNISADTISDAVKVTSVNRRILGGKYFSSSNRDVRRVARQGAFDNIHLAPTHTNAPGATTFTGLNKIYMAPFCEHDCLHTHWRWGEYNGKRHQHGWEATSLAWAPTATNRTPGAPNKVPGAPMVPDNQTINVVPVNVHEFRYEATAKGHSAARPGLPIPAGSWTFIFHHGSAYSLKLLDGVLAPSYAKLWPFIYSPTWPTGGGLTNSGKMYWGLRYVGYTDGGTHYVHEQLESIKMAAMRHP